MKILHLKPQIKGDTLVFIEEKPAEEKKLEEIEGIGEVFFDISVNQVINSESAIIDPQCLTVPFNFKR